MVRTKEKDSLYIYFAYLSNVLTVSRCVPLFFHTLFPFPLHLPPPSSLNSIAYRRVIRVYQYEVDDDLSGRSSPFFLPLIGLLTPHLFGFSSHALESDPHCKGSVCVCVQSLLLTFTAMRIFFFIEMNPSSFLMQNAWLHFGTSVEECEHFISFFNRLVYSMVQLFIFSFFPPIHLEENVHAPDSGWKLQCVVP